MARTTAGVPVGQRKATAGGTPIAVRATDTGERLVTRCDGDIISVAAVDERGRWLYFTASPDERDRSDTSTAPGSTAPADRALTPANPAGHAQLRHLAGRRWAFHTYSRFDTPPVDDWSSLPDHRVARTLADNAALKARGRRHCEATGRVLHGRYRRRRRARRLDDEAGGLRPGRKYPLLVYVYGEPAARRFSTRGAGIGTLFHRALANEASSSRAWTIAERRRRKGAAWRKLSTARSATCRRRSRRPRSRAHRGGRSRFVDAQRVGIWGWSGGGSNTLNALFRFPDVYKVGVASRAGSGPEALRHDLSGALHGPPAGQRRRAIASARRSTSRRG